MLQLTRQNIWKTCNRALYLHILQDDAAAVPCCVVVPEGWAKDGSWECQLERLVPVHPKDASPNNDYLDKNLSSCKWGNRQSQASCCLAPHRHSVLMGALALI